jgi:adrenodoxin-NADP+ reductase
MLQFQIQIQGWSGQKENKNMMLRSSSNQLLATCRRSALIFSNSHSPNHAALVRWLSSSSSSSNAPLQVAIVGSGPSGCYTAKYLQSALEKLNITARLDVLERLPTPFGLVRYGVAPDHPEVKNVEQDFSKLFQDSKTTCFYGNVHVGKDVMLDELRQLYDIVVLAYGCESDRKLNIPGQDLEGVLSAREFVAWYNGHPDFVHIGAKVQEALSFCDGDSSSIVVIGQGNVALDCARILAKSRAALEDTDIASHALPVLDSGGNDRSIHIVGRRGHVQGAFAVKELRELTKLQDCGADFVVRQEELEMGSTPASLEELQARDGRPKVRIDKLLQETASKTPSPELPTTVNLRFLVSPIRFAPDEKDQRRLGSVVCERTRLEGDPGNQKAVGTGELESFAAQLVSIVPMDCVCEWYWKPSNALLSILSSSQYVTGAGEYWI